MKGGASDSRHCEGKNNLPPIIKRKIKDGKRSPTIGGTGGKGKVTCKVTGTDETTKTKIISTIGVVAENKNIIGGEDRHTSDSTEQVISC